MKSQSYSKNTSYTIGFAILANLILVSCGTYQSVYNNDGIYDDEPIEEKVVVVKNQNSYNKTEESYFKEEIDAFNDLTDGGVFTDVDNYSSYDNLDDDYDNDPWGYSTSNDDSVVININVRNRFRNYWDFYDYNRYWGYQWGFRHGFYGDYVYYPYSYGYYNNFRFYNFYYSPYNYNRPFYNNNRFYNNSYNRNYTYTKRNSTNTSSRRNSSFYNNTNLSKRRASSINNRVNSVFNNINYNTRRRSNSVKNNNREGGSTNTSRRNSSVNTRRSNSSNNKNYNTRRSSSNSNKSYRSNTSSKRNSSVKSSSSRSSNNSSRRRGN